MSSKLVKLRGDEDILLSPTSTKEEATLVNPSKTVM